jgi:hypothetical protein
MGPTAEMSGPLANPHKPHSRHRQRGQVLVLPSECSLPAPELPGGRRWTPAHQSVWATLWSTGQAVMWDDSFVQTVAMYVVHSVAVISGKATAWQAQEARHLGDRIGLTPQGLLALGWRLAEPGEVVGDVTPLRSVK